MVLWIHDALFLPIVNINLAKITPLIISQPTELTALDIAFSFTPSISRLKSATLAEGSLKW